MEVHIFILLGLSLENLFLANEEFQKDISLVSVRWLFLMSLISTDICIHIKKEEFDYSYGIYLRNNIFILFCAFEHLTQIKCL